ncbi:hypothetical protein [Streptomyces cinnamoneus]|uniref:Uncharacterized protein n=1 Tax=Streptomyces cinnamoneus TaxID=53446 RepID=A0A918WN82_STRCJ|nr:hypothetical protein [Streptomyces cinnamoneus]GHC62499.1 hypothetical protein GCM10010507_44640 [Streptomyces cinnamoneus]
MSKATKLWRSLLSMAGTAILLVFAAGPALAEPDPTGAPVTTFTITLGDEKGASNDVITCEGRAYKPNYSGSAVVATGALTSCSRQPQTCRTETDLMRYYPGPGTFEVLAAGSVNYGCPPPSRSSTATFRHCQPSDVNWSYMSRTWVTISDGRSQKTGYADSSLLNVRCA